MLNLELPGVSLFKFGCFPDWSFFFLRRLSLRGMFRLFYAASKGVVRSKSKFFRKPERLNTTRRVEIFYETSART